MGSRPEEPDTRLDADSPTFDDADLASAVDTPSFAEVARTLFDLNDRDLETLNAIQAEPGVSIERIAERVDRNRSNISRSITRLAELGLVTRQRRIIESGGYFYAHYARSGETIERLFAEAVDRWADDAVAAVTDHQLDDDPDPFDD